MDLQKKLEIRKQKYINQMSQGQTLVTDLRCLFSSVLVQKIELSCKPLGSGGKSNVHRVFRKRKLLVKN